VSIADDRRGPVIEIPQPECHRCGARTFVMFERLPWCRRCFLVKVENPANSAALGPAS
jgi:hypothetical protein